MHRRLLLLLMAWLLVAGCSSRTEAPAPAPTSPTSQKVAPLAPATNKLLAPGAIIVTQVSGVVNMTANGTSTSLRVDSAVPQNAKINTAVNSSVALVCSNGAMIKLGADTELVVEEFLQDPFGATFRVAELVVEPSISRIRLALNRGELVGNVKRLKHDQGSSFTVQSPVGTAGIRGSPANFRLVFRPSGVGQASFSLSSAMGSVSFQQPSRGDDGILVPVGQEIAVTVKVTRNAQGKLSVEPAAPVQPKRVSPAKLP